MRKTTLIMVIMGVAVAALKTVMAQTLPLDSRRKVMQFTSGAVFVNYSPAADTLWHGVTVPEGAIECTIIPTGSALTLGSDSLYVKNKLNRVTIPDSTALTIPVINKQKIWVMRSATNKVVKAGFVFRR